MGCKERYFGGTREEVKIKLPRMMLGRLKQLCIEDVRPSLSRELSYLLGCKLEAIDRVIKQQQERARLEAELDQLISQRGVLWAALTTAIREKEIDSIWVDLRFLLLKIAETKEAISDIQVPEEPGVPGQ